MMIHIVILSLALTLSLTPMWTVWYKPIDITRDKYYSSMVIILSILWFIHLEIQLPMPSGYDRATAKKYLPRYK